MKKRYLMKKNSFIVLFLLCNFFAFAQPTTITYQGKLLDNIDMPVSELAVAFTFAIYDAESGGNKIWPPSNPVATKSIDIVNGLYSVILGTGSGNDQAIEPGIFNGITPYLEVGVNATTLPRTRITSVPFSIISNNLSSSAWASPGAIGSATPNSGTFTALTVGTTTNTYTFPSEDGNGGQVLTTDGSGGTTWATPATGGLTNFTESNYIFNTKTGVKLLAANAATNVDVVLQPKGNGGILAQQPDGVVTGGNNRGTYAVDLQMIRSTNTQVASGDYSTISGGYRNTASNMASTIGGGYSNLASNYNSTVGGGRINIAMGLGSTVAGGDENNASGEYSAIAGGRTNVASGDISTSSGGYLNTASGYMATVSGGYNNTASGNFSFANGFSNTAQSYGESVLGLYATVVSGTASSYVVTDRLFVVGNGTGTSARSNALTILKNGNTTVGGSLSINGNGTNASVTFPLGRGTIGQVLTTDGSGGTSWATPSAGGLTNFTESNYTYDSKTGVKLLATNAATNVDVVLQPKGNGGILAQQPDGAVTGGNNRGTYAVDLQMTRSTNYQVASGYASTVGGGTDNTASGENSIVGGGNGNAARGSYSIVGSGFWNTASGNYSTIGGGVENTASGSYSIVGGGFWNNASGNYSTIGGGVENTSSGAFSFANGFSNTAQSYGESVLGLFATVGSGTASSYVATDRLFVVGNGTDGVSRSNALTMLKNGSFTSSTGASLTAGGVWTNASDKRLKEQIVDTKYGLSTVLSLRPVDYKMIKDGNVQVGFIAQEVREIIPEVISGIEGDLQKGETLGISYGNLVPVLTKAIQEQQAIIESLREELNDLKEELASSQNFNKLMLDKFAELTDKLTILSEEKQNLLKSVN
jgi:hypothetical protein